MTPAQFKRLETLFALAQQSDVDRHRVLAELQDEPELLARLDRMLAAHEVQDAKGDQADPIQQAVAGYADSVAEDADASIGQQLGPYQLKEVLGRGGMGAVYLGERVDDAYHKQVAVKRIRLGLDDPLTRRRFLRERQILASLEHSGLARLLDGGTDEFGAPFVVMEYVDGTPITSYRKKHQLSLTQTIKLFIELCNTVQFVHRNLVVHRDIKPSNVLVTADREVKLLDFGIARLLDQELSEKVTAASQAAMTPEYASPEQILGQRVSTASDIYALGLLLYELLTDTPAFKAASSPIELARRAAGPTSITPSRALTADQSAPYPVQRLRGDLDTIVLMATRREPERRYGSVQALARDLENFLSSRPITARADSWWYVSRKFVRRHRFAVAAAITIAALAAALLSTSLVQSQRLAAERDLALARETEAEQVAEFLINMFEQAEPNQAQGKPLTALELVDLGHQEIQSALQSQPVVKARLMSTLSQVYRRLSALDQAEALARESLALNVKAFGSNSFAHADQLSRLARIEYLQGHSEQAIEKYQQALGIFDQLGESDRKIIDARLRNLGQTAYLLSKDQPEHAEQLLLDALAWAEDIQPPLTNRVDELRHHLALLYKRQEKDLEAEALLRQVLASLTDRNESLYHSNIAIAFTDLAVVQDRQGRKQQALANFEQAIEIDRKLYGPEHPALLNNQRRKANLLREFGQPRLAYELLREALARSDRVNGPDHRQSGSLRAALVRVSLQLGYADEAESLSREALQVAIRTYGPNHRNVASVSRSLGRALLLQERWDRAEAHLQRALAIRQSDEKLNPALIGEVQLDLATLALRRGDPAAALKHAREAAESCSQTVDGRDCLLGSQSTVGQVKLKLGDINGAIAQLEIAYQQALQRAGSDHWLTAEVGAHLGVAWTQTGRVPEGVELMRQSHATLNRALGAEHQFTQRVASQLAESL